MILEGYADVEALPMDIIRCRKQIQDQKYFCKIYFHLCGCVYSGTISMIEPELL
jgi:hypothetical protein